MTAVAESGRILYVTHNGLTEPLGRRQVLPYLEGLSRRGWRFTVVSFEKASTATAAQKTTVDQIVSTAGIEWRPLWYHNRPPLLATAFDVVHGWMVGSRLVRSVELIHARSSVPALMAQLISAGAPSSKVPWVFDVRGLIADEYVDAGYWTDGSFRQRVTAGVERRLLEQADGLVTLTHRIVERLPPHREGRASRPSAVIPCCVDLEVFRPSSEWRRTTRNVLRLGDEPVLAYSGSLGSWYRLDEMFDFYEVASRTLPGLHFLLLTPQAAIAQQVATARGLSSRVTAVKLDPDDVPHYLAAADAGICFLGKYGSKVASSPTKYSEYLAAGLPVVTNGWIGDAASFASEQCWILVSDFSEPSYQRAAAHLASLFSSPASTRAAARDLADREFALATAVDRYDALYRRVLTR